MAVKLMLVVGARPNFMKAAPLYAALKVDPAFELRIVHTGQHYDYKMSLAFFEDLDLPEADHCLEVGSGSHAEQTAQIMLRFEKVLVAEKPHLVIVFGDVNSTIACGLTAVKLGIPLAHVEAGLRSFDPTMPEEINRRLTDAISELLFTPSQDGNDNLKREGVPDERIHLVGNIMIDSLKKATDEVTMDVFSRVASDYGVVRGEYGLVTLHRPFNVDDSERLSRIFEVLGNIAAEIPLLFPLHPRTRKNLEILGIDPEADSGVRCLQPLRFKEFITLEKNAKFVITDSGGIQEETTHLRIRCLTLRPNTERPITVSRGSNQLVTLENLEREALRIIRSGETDIEQNYGVDIPLWDGKTASRIVGILHDWMDHRPS